MSTDTLVVTARHLIGYVSAPECGQAHVSFESQVVSSGTMKGEPSGDYVDCAPRYAGSYHLNWRWLWLFGRSLDAARSTLLYPSGLLLYRFLRNSFEKRTAKAQEGEDQGKSKEFLRPMSMKLCPPNHYLSGIQVRKADSRVFGISAIICIPHDASSSNETTTKNLEAPTATFDFTFSSPDVLQAQFNLTQLIGDPASTQGVNETIECPNLNGQPSAITVVSFEYENQNILRNLAVKCDTLP